MNEKKEEKKKELTMKISSSHDITKGAYSNTTMIFHNKNEFIIDFLFSIANNHELVSRVILSPTHMKDFYRALGDNIRQYEERFQKKKK